MFRLATAIFAIIVAIVALVVVANALKSSALVQTLSQPSNQEGR